jgi:hypothetical protein
MTPNGPTPSNSRQDNFDSLITAWLDSDARIHVPDDLLVGVLTRTSRTRPLPAWRLPERWIPMQLALRFQPRPGLAPLLVIAALIVATVLAAVLIAGSQHRLPPPFGIADDGRLAFINGDQLVTENPDGSGVVIVRPSSPVQQAPSFSRDGTKLVYKNVLADHVVANVPTQVDIVVADANGSHANVIVHDVNAGNPLWSPDGSLYHVHLGREHRESCLGCRLGWFDAARRPR